MPLQEMTHVEQHNSLIPTAEDIYDDGFLRVEHKNYYVACGGSPKAAPHRVFDLLAAGANTKPDRRVRRAVELSVGNEQAAQYRKPPRLHLSPPGQARRVRTANRNDGQRRLPAGHRDAGPVAVNSEFRCSSARCNTRCLDLSFAKTLAHSPTVLEMLNVCVEDCSVV